MELAGSSVVVVLGSVAGRVIFWEGICEFVHQPHQQAIEDRILQVFADFKAIPTVVPFPRKNSSRKYGKKQL